MFVLPDSPILFAFWCVLWSMFALAARHVTRTALRELRRRRRVEFQRVLELPLDPPRINQVRRDPSPRQRAS